MIGSTLTKDNDLKGKKVENSQRSRLVILYAVFGSIAMLVHHWISGGEFSSVVTLSALFELLAFCLLGVHILTGDGVHGISAKSLQLELIALLCRLSSTTWLLGYLPDDPSGDHLYQCIDILSVVVVLGLLYQIMRPQRKTYDADNDDLSLVPFVAVAFVLAGLLHGDLDERPIFDTLWYTGLFLACVAPVPYLWLMVRNKGPIPALASHFVAAMAMSRILSGAYMWEAHEEFTCEPYIGEFNHAGWAVIAAHVLHLILLADFAYFYLKNLMKAGLKAPMQLDDAWTV